MFDTAFNVSKDYATAKFVKEENPWDSSPFHFIVNATLDERGSWGEKFLFELCKEKEIEVSWDDASNTNQINGTYDLLIEDKRVEVKTAYRGKNNSWQHEGILSDSVYDTLVLIDIDYDCIHINMIPQSHIAKYAPTGEKDPIFKKKYTQRQKEEGKFKFDFSQTTLKYARDNNMSADYKCNESNEDLADFLENIFNDNKL